MKKASKKQIDERIERVYGARCRGVQIDVLDIGKVFGVGRKAVEEKVDDKVLGDRIAAFVEN